MGAGLDRFHCTIMNERTCILYVYVYVYMSILYVYLKHIPFKLRNQDWNHLLLCIAMCYYNTYFVYKLLRDVTSSVNNERIFMQATERLHPGTILIFKHDFVGKCLSYCYTLLFKISRNRGLLVPVAILRHRCTRVTTLFTAF